MASSVPNQGAMQDELLLLIFLQEPKPSEPRHSPNAIDG